MVHHKATWCKKKNGTFCQEDFCDGCSIICTKIDTCYKVRMVMDKDLAGDWQYAHTIRRICAICQDKEIE